MIEKLKKQVHRILCRLGYHEYEPSTWEVHRVMMIGDYMIYRCENRCTWCGYKNCTLLRLPKLGGRL